jgi:pimeloyl-ACP methyl ester carboxylesterase
VPARVLVPINFAATMHFGYVYAKHADAATPVEWAECMEHEGWPEPTRRLGTFAVLDHVGKSFYPSAWAFAEECAERGPSRRITRQEAVALAGRLPCPVVFTHNNAPCFADMDECVVSLDFLRADKSWLATWLRDGFGITAGAGGYGFDHPVVDILERLDSGMKMPTREAVFGGSWLTYVGQVIDEGEELEPALADAGVCKIVTDYAE